MELKNVTISTDGACSCNPGPGGYAAIIRFTKKDGTDEVREIAGYDERTTNNKMELKAVIEAIAKLKKPCFIKVRTDSMVVCNAIAELDAAHDNGWKKKTGGRRANIELLQQLYDLKKGSKLIDADGNNIGEHKLIYEHVKGHNGDPDNERCDQLARAQIALNAG